MDAMSAAATQGGSAADEPVWLAARAQPAALGPSRDFDLIGLPLMAVFLGSLEYALQEGPHWDWLDEKSIRVAVIVSTVTGSLFFWRALSYRPSPDAPGINQPPVWIIVSQQQSPEPGT
jgi:hypothetical protein